MYAGAKGEVLLAGAVQLFFKGFGLIFQGTGIKKGLGIAFPGFDKLRNIRTSVLLHQGIQQSHTVLDLLQTLLRQRYTGIQIDDAPGNVGYLYAG